MIDKLQPYKLNSRNLLYIKQTNGQFNENKEKTLYEIASGYGQNKKSDISPIINVSSKNNGQLYSYTNFNTMDIVSAKKSDLKNNYTVSVPTKNGGKVIGYINNNRQIAWTKDKKLIKLLNKISLIIKNGI